MPPCSCRGPGLPKRVDRRLAGAAFIAGFLLGALAMSSAASADNAAPIDGLKIDVDYVSCTTTTADNSKFCGNERWQVDVDGKGWSAEGAMSSISGDISWRVIATCRDGLYRADTNGQVWPGQCELSGDRSHPCFRITGGSSSEAIEKVEITQCFEITDQACTMELSGLMTGRESLAGEHVISVQEVKSCRVEQAQ